MKTMLFLFAALALVAGCSADQNASTAPGASPSNTIPLTTYKSATCGCCKLWVEHARDNGFEIKAQNVSDLNAIKREFLIAAKFQSCHTSVADNGYVFEGHIPAKLIRQFLQNPPTGARGLSVPAMPLGSPGMEMGDRFVPYKVLQLNKDGSSSVYASIEQFEQQH